MKLTLLAHTPNPDQVVATAARLCYSSQKPEEIWSALSSKEQATLIRKLRSAGHDSPLEHASFTFAVEGVSRALSHQLVRHRMASYSQRSQRYVGEGEFGAVTPPSITENPEAHKEYLRIIDLIKKGYTDLIGMGIPKEDARYLLPNACQTHLIMTMNARSLLNFLELRCCRRAQWEIRELAWEIRRILISVAPLIFSISGPSCLVTGDCQEGNFSCGQPYRQDSILS